MYLYNEKRLWLGKPMSPSEATRETDWLQDNILMLRVFNGYALMYVTDYANYIIKWISSIRHLCVALSALIPSPNWRNMKELGSVKRNMRNCLCKLTNAIHNVSFKLVWNGFHHSNTATEREMRTRSYKCPVMESNGLPKCIDSPYQYSIWYPLYCTHCQLTCFSIVPKYSLPHYTPSKKYGLATGHCHVLESQVHFFF